MLSGKIVLMPVKDKKRGLVPTLGKELEYKKPGSLKDFKLGKKSAHCTGKQKESLSVSD